MSPVDLPPSNLKAVLFDIDGTLVESDPLHVLAFNATLTAFGEEPISEAFFYQNVSGTHTPTFLAKQFPKWSSEKIVKFDVEKEAKFREFAMTQLEETKGLDNICAYINKNGLKKAAVTNSPRINAEFMLKGIGKMDYFDLLIIGSECPRAKPNPDPYIIAMHELNVKPKDVIVVEDSVSGVQAGLAAGTTVVGITSGRSAEELIQLGCSYTINDFDDLVRLLQQS
eukprot:TRINITY_DN1578_c0_g1_i1.p2 TRINITY_DN1578_c0_g1~~TRINITY_DN1578_c0_g1_i1.p2  ORF type:complete len:226 (+),score=31.14 TRINITY_DN1578_c0_g1_i1:102-779(+)